MTYLVVVVVVEVAGEVVVVLEGAMDDVSVVVVLDGVVDDVVVDVVGLGFGASTGTAMTVVDDAGGVLTTGGGLFTTVGFSHALTTTTASDAANNIEYFMIISPGVQKEMESSDSVAAAIVDGHATVIDRDDEIFAKR